MKNIASPSLLKLILVIVAPVLCASAQTSEQIVLRQGLDGYTGTSSNIIIAGGTGNSNTTKNYGAGTSFLIGAGEAAQRRALLRFDLSDYAGKTVLGDATLKLRQVNTGTTEGTYEINVYQIAAANANWVAGTGSGFGNEALAGESAWAFKAKGTNGEPDILWAGSAGLGTAGVDYVAAPIATITYNTDEDGTDVLITIPEELIQLWIDSPSDNGGLLLARTVFLNGILGGFRSESWSGAAQRPELTFSVVVPEPSVAALALGGAVVALLVVRQRRRVRR